MQPQSVHPQAAIEKLERLAGNEAVPTRDAARCAQLFESLQRPARVCLMGSSASDVHAMAGVLLGAPDALRGKALPPAVQLTFGNAPRTRATLEDGTLLSCEGWPDHALLSRAPVFLELEAPVPTFRHMSFLVLSLDTAPHMHRPALSWAARRAEMAVWCTPAFTVEDAQIWGAAPERLTHHAFLVETRSAPDALRHGAVADFAERFQLPHPLNVNPLLDRLRSDIEDARIADLDSAQVLLHRLGHYDADANVSTGTGQSADLLDTNPAHPVPVHPDLRRALSEPILFLSRRARALAEDIAWIEPGESCQTHIVAHATETVEGLRERAEDWPDDIPECAMLRTMLDEVGDILLLSRTGTDAEQSEDAAALLYQLRQAFEWAIQGKGHFQ